MEQAVTVTQLTQSIKQHLEGRFASVIVEGEVSNYRKQSSGHLYFSLKDATSQISSVMFQGSTHGLARLPRDGDQVLVRGEISVYAPRGQYQLIIRQLQYQGTGALLALLEERKKKLWQLGWCDEKHKKPIPRFVSTVCVITSPTGAAIRDILHILTASRQKIHVQIYPVLVQGEGAASEIALAIEQANVHRLADVIIVGRGGGSIEDLWPFNEGIVVKAVFSSTIPIISAVGHEIDHMLSDLVADLRAPTPSAAAQKVLEGKQRAMLMLEQWKEALSSSISQCIEREKKRIDSLRRHSLLASPHALLHRYMQSLDELQLRFAHGSALFFDQKKQAVAALAGQLKWLSPSERVLRARQQLAAMDDLLLHRLEKNLERHRAAVETVQKQLGEKVQNALEKKARAFSFLCQHLSSVNPKNVLQRGYAIVSDDHRIPLTSAKNCSRGEKIAIAFADGKVSGEVKEIELHAALKEDV